MASEGIKGFLPKNLPEIKMISFITIKQKIF